MLNLFHKIVIRFIFGLGIILFFIACEGHPKGVLSQDEMTGVLTDLHKLDGSLYEKGFQYGHFPDKTPYYNFILKKHGITEAQFDSSLVWYTKNPKQFEEIYTDVIAQLSNFDSIVKSNKFHPIDSARLAIIDIKLWKKGTKYSFTNDSTRTKLNFEIIDSTLLLGDTYIFQFLQRISPQDSCSNQHIVFRINYTNGKSDSVSVATYNDSLLRRYTMRLFAVKKLKIKSLSGELLGSNKYKGDFSATLDSISLLREYNALKLDKMKKIMHKAFPTLTPKKIISKSDSLNRVNAIHKIPDRKDQLIHFNQNRNIIKH